MILPFQPHVFPRSKLSTSLQNLRFSKKPKALEEKGTASVCSAWFFVSTPIFLPHPHPQVAAPSTTPHRFPYRKREADRPAFPLPLTPSTAELRTC